jgi:hypothetical protein
MYTLATLYQLRARLGLAANETADDARLLNALAAATTQIERATGRRFLPRKAILAQDFTGSTELLLDDDLLELTSVTNGDASAISLSDVLTIPADGPAGLLHLTGSTAFTWKLLKRQAITVTGTWGWHDQWATAWRDSGDTVQNNPLSSGATTLTVASASAADAAGESPRFQVGHLLKIDGEYLWVLGISGNALTVARAANGSAAVSHAQNTPVYTYQPPADLAALALRWAAWLYREPDSAAFASAPDTLLAAVAHLRRTAVRV